MDGKIREQLLTATDEALLRACEVDCYRASGPGGQHRNKTDSAVRLRLKSAAVVVIAEDSRSQHDNKHTAVGRMRLAIATEVRLTLDLSSYQLSPRIASLLAAGTKPLGEKTRKKPEFLLAVADLLDLLFAHGGQVAATANAIGCTTGALSKMLLVDDKVAKEVNHFRATLGLKALR